METDRFDPKQYERYYLREENIDLLDVQDEVTRDSLLINIKQRVKNEELQPLLKRNFRSFPEGGGENGHPTLRLMQWNILAQGLSMGKDNFVRCPKKALDWETRRIRIVEEILEIDPDVLCMQEVDHFGLFLPLLKSIGYEGLFFPKPDSPCLYTADTNGPDGCAFFFKENKFNVIEKDFIILKAYGVYSNQVCIIVTLQPKDCDKQLTIATTHLKAKQGWYEMRKQQGDYLLDYLKKKVGDGALVVCGDLNGDITEPVYKAFSDSSLCLQSAYTLFSKDGKEPPYTTWKFRAGRVPGKDYESCRTIDYIWYSREKIGIFGLCEIPTGEEIGDDRLPSFQYPSDHFSLAADLVLK